MSTYPFMARSKTKRGNGEIVSGMAIDDYFGRHQYGYKVTGKHHVMRQKTFDARYEQLETTYEAEHGTFEPEGDYVKETIEAIRANKASNQIQPIFEDDDPRSRTFLLTDACLWEMNKGRETYHPHAIEVVDTETGQVRYIESGAHIKFVSGSISAGRDQDKYNKYA